jgi:hypothetical protein
VSKDETMPAPPDPSPAVTESRRPDPSQAVTESRRPDLQALLASEREMLAKRIADAPAAWISIPMWGRVFMTTRRLLRLDRGRAR